MKIAIENFPALNNLYSTPGFPAFITGISEYFNDPAGVCLGRPGWQKFEGNATERIQTPEDLKKLLTAMQASGATTVNLMVLIEDAAGDPVRSAGPDYKIKELI